MTKAESKNLIDFLLSSPKFDQDVIDAMNDRSRETGSVLGIDHVQITVPPNSEQADTYTYDPDDPVPSLGGKVDAVRAVGAQEGKDHVGHVAIVTQAAG